MWRLLRVLGPVVLCLPALAADSPIRVDQSTIKLDLRREPTILTLAVDNSLGRVAGAGIHLEWVSPGSQVRSVFDRDVTLSEGRNALELPFPLTSQTSRWDRLRYRVRVGTHDASGVLALTEIAPELYELRVTAPTLEHQKTTYTVHALTVHQGTNAPVPGVKIRGVLKLDDHQVTVEAVSNAGGYAALAFALPANPNIEDGDLTVESELGSFRQDVAIRMGPHMMRRTQVDLATDKPMYQPGQTLHARVVAYGPDWRVVPGRSFKLVIENEERERVYSTTLETNRFGVAAADWAIPENVKLGRYLIHPLQGDEYGAWDGGKWVRISRYELPEFTVSVKPDRAYYLPGQTPVVEVSADYLFGKPVPGAAVKVTRQESREWDFKEQKWEVREEKTSEGTTNQAGRFTVRLNLAETFEDIGDYRKFKDVTFAAYVTDPSTRRTEERRFDIRATREAIHVYVWDTNSGHFVSTAYADGKPASCRVTVTGGGTLTTNRYGLARFTPPKKGDEEIDYELTANDGHGATGALKDSGTSSWEAPIRVTSGKTLYRPGESIRATIVAREPMGLVEVDLVSGSELLDSRVIDLGKTPVDLEFPWQEAFRREIIIGAAQIGTNETGFRTVLFPADAGFRLNAKPERPEYRPGEEAAVSFESTLADGSKADTALGVAIVDSAVGERARTDGLYDTGVFNNWRAQTASTAGVTLQDLYALDCSKPFSPDLDLVAEAMLSGRGLMVASASSLEDEQRLSSAFDSLFREQFAGVTSALDARFRKNYDYPQTHDALVRALAEAQIDFDSLRDPWGTPYQTSFRLEGAYHRLDIHSAGPDKRFKTADDLTAAGIIRPHFLQTSDAMSKVLDALPAWPSSADGARTALRAAKIDPDHLPDPWGTPCQLRFEISREFSVLSFSSAGPDRVFQTKDDFRVGQIRGSYFKAVKAKLEETAKRRGFFPTDEQSWIRLQRLAGEYPVRDAWGHAVRVTFHQEQEPGKRLDFYTSAKFGEKPQRQIESVSITRTKLQVLLYSAGPDGKHGTADDFVLASLSTIKASDIAAQQTAGKTGNAVVTRRGSGVIHGAVVDPQGAAIPNATVSATRIGFVAETKTNDRGEFLLAGLQPGRYEVIAKTSGFMRHVAKDVPVTAGKVTELQITLQPGVAMETVTVESASTMMATASTSSASIRALPLNARIVGPAKPQSTPRLREYFAETLLWEPMIQTGPDGRAQVRFKLADNITTWKLEAIGTTADGEVATATADIRAFQPFFVDHNPPRILTAGDHIDVPVTIRNYLERALAVTAVMKPETWFVLTSGGRRDIKMGAGESGNVVFPIRAAGIVKDGRQRVTATADETGDAIEKPITVHPDGNETAFTVNGMVRDTTTLDVRVPENAIAGATSAELRIYPTLIAHLAESIEAIMQRPYGCGEQTISSSYPSLLMLRYLKETGQQDGALGAKARKYLLQGVERLARYRDEDGGYTYWGHGEQPDRHLTAYALEFLEAAAEFADVDKEKLEETRELLKELKPAENTRDSVYRLAENALAAQRAGETAKARELRTRLRLLAMREQNFAYWQQQEPTPFYGWGIAGRIELTALAMRALAAGGDPQDKSLLDSALVFLMQNKDRYGVWFSTQATVQVLQALLGMAGRESGEEAGIAVAVNGKEIGNVSTARRGEAPQPIDVAPHLKPGANTVQIVRRGSTSPAQIQVRGTYWLPWPSERRATPGPVTLAVAYDKTTAAIGELVTCTVTVGRARPYGMLLAEIGLPPGAEVDRNSLDKSKVSHYEVRPDRVVVYLWGAAQFSFSFRPRFAMRAKTAPSLVYDYYNPEAAAVAAPATFTVSAADTRNALPKPGPARPRSPRPQSAATPGARNANP